ncbi:MAG: SDR family NAD(P)-dependent oxidoreductase [Novosphingobium sp.]
MESNRLDGKVAIVTGAIGEIGAASAALMAARGARIVAIDRPGSDFAALRNSVSGDPLCLEADVTDEAGVAASIAATVAHFGRIDILFNNAGIEGPVEPLATYSLEAFRKVMAVNVEGVFLGMKHALPHMVRQQSGSVINASSLAGLCGAAGMVAYNTSKHAVIGLTRVAALEVAGHGVRVNCINPGPIAGRMIDRLDAETGVSAEFRAGLIPAQRYGTPQEVAAVVAFLASDDARYINASIHSIDGGLNAIA